MAIKFIAGTEDVPKPLVNQFDPEDGWWAGIRQQATLAVAVAATALALSTSVAVQTTSLHQDDPAGSLVNLKVDEVYWQNPTAPTYLSFTQYVPPDSDFVSPPAVFQPDEDYWQQPLPQQASFVQFQPWSDQDFVTFLPDEDFWTNPVRPVPATFANLYSYDAAEWVAPAVVFHPEEDYWLNPIAPLQATMYVTLPLGDPEASTIVPQPVVGIRPNSIRGGIESL